MDYTSDQSLQQPPSPGPITPSRPVAPPKTQHRPPQIQGLASRPSLSQHTPSFQRAVHTIVHKLPEGNGEGATSRSSFGGSPRYTNSPVGSSGCPRSLSGLGSPYLTPPIIEGDEPPPFKPDKGDRISLSMYEGPQGHDSEGVQRLRNREGHSSQVLVAASQRRSRGKRRHTGYTELKQYGEKGRPTRAEHGEVEGGGLSGNFSYILPPSPHSSPRFSNLTRDDYIGRGSATTPSLPLSPFSLPHHSTVIQDDYISRSPVAGLSLPFSHLISPRFSTLTQHDYFNQSHAAAVSQGSLSAQSVPPISPRSEDGLPLHKAIIDRKGDADVEEPSFLTALSTFYLRVDSTLRELSKARQGKALKARTGRDHDGHCKERAKTDRLGPVPDTPATITLRRASSAKHKPENGRISISGSARMSRQRQDDLRDSLISNFLPPQRHLTGQHRERSLSELCTPPGRCGLAEPVTTYTTSCRASDVAIGTDNPLCDKTRKAGTTTQNIQSGSSMYEVIWKDDHTPCDFKAKLRETRGISSLADDQTDGSGTCCSIRSGSRMSLESLDSDFKEFGKAYGWSWTGTSHQDNFGTCVQFGFESRDSSTLHHTDGGLNIPAISKDPVVFIESFPSLPERKSTLEWKTPNVTRLDEASAVKDHRPQGYPDSTAPTAEHTLDPLATDRNPNIVLPVLDLSDSAHSSPRGRQSCRSSIQPHPGARSRTAEEPKVGFALGISTGLRRSRSNNLSSLPRAPTPLPRCRSACRIQCLKDDTKEVMPTCLPGADPDRAIDNFSTSSRKSSYLSGCSIPQESDDEARKPGRCSR